jgi:hypothetical protein
MRMKGNVKTYFVNSGRARASANNVCSLRR